MPDWFVSAFSPIGLLIAVLQQIPGVVWAVRPPDNDPFSRNSGSPLVEAMEKTFGIGSLALIVFVLARFTVPAALATLALAGSFIVIGTYYAFYVLYYRGVISAPILLGMAAFPPLAFFLVALYQGNWPALAACLAFGVVHVSLTYSNLIAKPGGSSTPVQ